MKVVMFSGLQGFGGIQKFTLDLHTELVKAFGVDMSVYDTGKVQCSTEGNSRASSLREYRYSVFRRLYKIMLEADVIHFNGFTIMPALVAFLFRRKLVYTEHGTLQRANRKGKKWFIKNLLTVPYVTLVPRIMVFNSNWLRQNVCLRRNNQIVIYNGINFGPDVMPQKNIERIVLVIVARLVERKMVHRAIDVLKELLRSDDAVLYIIGSGPEETRLKLYANAIGVGEMVMFEGYRTNVEKYYQMGGYFVLTTQYEPFGLVVLESLNHGMPVCCFSDAGGALEIIDKIPETLIGSKPTELARLIRQNWLTTGAYERMSFIQQRHVRSHFPLARTCESYFQIFAVISGYTDHCGNDERHQIA